MTDLDQTALNAAADAMSEASYDAMDGRDAARRVVEAYLRALPGGKGAELKALGLWGVVEIRMSSLADAVRGRKWDEAEWHFDRVRSALDKFEAGGAPRGAGGRPTR